MVSWERLSEQTQGEYVVADFEKAAYRLIVEQVLYASDRFSRVSYHLIVKHFTAYRDVLSKLGMSLIHNHHHSYVAAIPTHQVAEKMRLSEWGLALVLRRLYDDRMNEVGLRQRARAPFWFENESDQGFAAGATDAEGHGHNGD